jgi:branched-chain amino acid transport system ATP-binding protein
MLFTSAFKHDARMALDLCDRVVVLDYGRMIAEGVPEEVRATSVVEAAYRGASSESG